MPGDLRVLPDRDEGLARLFVGLRLHPAGKTDLRVPPVLPRGELLKLRIQSHLHLAGLGEGNVLLAEPLVAWPHRDARQTHLQRPAKEQRHLLCIRDGPEVWRGPAPHHGADVLHVLKLVRGIIYEGERLPRGTADGFLQHRVGVLHLVGIKRQQQAVVNHFALQAVDRHPRLAAARWPRLHFDGGGLPHAQLLVMFLT